MKAGVLCAAVMLAACSDLEPIDPNECGNGIIELGEDCDATNERCVGCAIRCSAEETCASYPGAEGFVCGADNVCHAPLGTFKTPSELSAAVETFRVTDVDRDGIGDVMIQSQTALSVFYGNFEGAPVRTTSTLTPIARGPAAYADVDEDGALDLLLPTSDGIAAYTSTFGVPSPHPFPNPVGEIGVPLYTWEVTPTAMAFIGALRSAPNRLKLIRFDVTDPTLQPIGVDICGDVAIDPAAFKPELVDVYTVAPGHQLVAMTLDPSGGAPRVCVMSIRETGSGPELARVLLTPPGFVARGRPLLAPTIKACPSLVVRSQVGDAVELPPGSDVARCDFLAQPRVLLTGLGTEPVGWVPLGPAGTGGVGLVFTRGIYRYEGGTALLTDRLYAADRRLALAKATDVDGDGHLDVVASGVTGTTADDPVEDLDILYQDPSTFLFLRYRLDTAGPVTLFATGDYDGNGRADIALVQQQDRDGRESQELAIAYGTADQLLPPTGLVAFSDVQSLVVTDLPDSTDPAGLVDDMIVLYGTGAQSQLTLLHGSPQRTLTGFFDPRSIAGLEDVEASLFRGVVGGRFESGTTVPGLDLLAVEALDLPESDLFPYKTRLWLSDGATGGIGEAQPPYEITTIARCDRGMMTVDGICAVDARFVAVPRPDGGLDRVLGVDESGRGLLIERTPGPLPEQTTFTAFDDIAALVPTGVLRDLDVVELATGLHLIASFALPATVIGCSLDATTGLPASCAPIAELLADTPRGPYQCMDATAARVTTHARGPSAPELVGLCRSSVRAGATLFRFAADDGGNLVAHPLLEIEDAHDLRAGDVNGDGLDDLVTVDQRGAIPTFRLYTQCTTRDTTGCRGAL